MHLLETQSLSSGQTISKIQIYDKYFPLPFQKYIVFAPFSKDSKNYDYYQDVLAIIAPQLNERGIKIIQIGGPNERPFNGTYYIAGQTSINQAAYIIKKSLLFFGADSFGQHLAGHYNIPLVDIVSNNYAKCVAPYFGDTKKQIILEPERKYKEKPTFSFQENPKSINRIHPELVADAVLKLLDIPNTWQYKQEYVGPIYIAGMLISVGDAVINPQQMGTDSLIMDLTINNNQDFLFNQLQVCPCSVLTSMPLKEEIFNFNKASRRIKEIVYLIDENHNPEFAKTVIRNGIPFKMISKLPKEKLNSFKLDYMDIGLIFDIIKFDPKEIDSLKDKNLSELYFKSSKFFISKGKVYPSKAHIRHGLSITSFEEVSKVIDEPDFWETLDSFRILSKKTV